MHEVVGFEAGSGVASWFAAAAVLQEQGAELFVSHDSVCTAEVQDAVAVAGHGTDAAVAEQATYRRP